MLLLPFSYSLRWRIPTEKGGGLSDRRLFDVRDGSCGEPRQISLEIAGEEKKNEGEKGREMKNERKNGKAVLGNK